jgi:hypothetical protein
MSESVPAAASPAVTLRTTTPAWLRFGFWFCILIAVAVVLRRLVALAHPSQSGPPQLVGLDTTFASHTALTLAHIIPALVFVLLLPFFFLHRFTHTLWLERFLYPIGAIVGITAYAMSADAIGGWIERSAVLFFNTLYLCSLTRSYLYARSVQPQLQRRWMVRAVGILLGIATTRPVMGVFFATSRLTHLEPQQFFGLAFWVGFSINTLAVELWLRSRNSRLWIERLAQSSVSGPGRACFPL